MRGIRRARRLGMDGVRRGIDAIADADRRTKLGEVDAELALDLLVCTLCGLGARQGPGARR